MMTLLNFLPRYFPFVLGIHRSPVNSLRKGQWRGTLMFSLICAWTNGWVNNRDTGDLRRHDAHYDVTIMTKTDREVEWRYPKHGIVASIIQMNNGIKSIFPKPFGAMEKQNFSFAPKASFG